jgi:peptidoglycan/LPS O-acetylase OafA/YrhL
MVDAHVRQAGPFHQGVLWSITQVGSLLTLLGFTVATWGLFRRASWWDEAAIGSAILGLAVLVPYWIAAHNSGETTPWWNVLVHAVGAAGVLILLTVPALASWVNGHVMAGK